ncbi:U-box domain-containing protein [Actinidia chinensis var. chinensis]|uniref:U-box domain-containing protein n=1 Tax=Actinidia chinensis var. chinensis TaxID=1590841 RepID=A0A2R6RNX8_ACTCC|nr:U-box domain-containing protein [Actinidia chinensis var. chinensis]
MARDKNELYVTVPSFFRCPISMDVMKSPVSLCTGVTYDRSSIQTWLDGGHNTCPATMQILPSTDFVPNLTLRSLILHWSQSSQSNPPVLSKQQLLDSIKKIDKTAENRLDSLSRIADFAKFSDENREFLASMDGFVPTILGIMKNVDDIEVLESIMTVLDLIVSEDKVKEQLHRLVFKCEGDCLSRFVLVLERGNLRSRTDSARVLELIAVETESQRAITDKQGLLFELHRLISSEVDSPAVGAGLSCLIAVSTSRPVKKQLVRFGIVRTAGGILSCSDTVGAVIEKALKLLEMVSTCAEGRSAIGEDETCVAAIVKRLMKVSRSATEHGVAVLWSVCYLYRDRTAQETAMKNNGFTKVLLAMQSDCAANTRRMCGDLVKVFRVNSKSCLASYETKTTHIMPY